MKYFAVYLLCISLITVAVTAYDKAIAGRKRVRRVPEATLFLLALLGGAAAEYITMKCIRHKTLHRRFMWGLPMIALVQAAVLYWLFAVK